MAFMGNLNDHSSMRRVQGSLHGFSRYLNHIYRCAVRYQQLRTSQVSLPDHDCTPQCHGASVDMSSYVRSKQHHTIPRNLASLSNKTVDFSSKALVSLTRTAVNSAHRGAASPARADGVVSDRWCPARHGGGGGKWISRKR